MAHISLRANLNAAIFPFASDFWGRSIIVPQYDQNFDRNVIASGSADQDKDKGIPQAFYMHNVVPTVHGYQSIGYDLEVAGVLGATEFDQIFPLQADNTARFLFSPAGGLNYIYDATVAAWASVSPFATGTISPSTLITTAFIHGKSYIAFEGIGVYKYDTVTKTLIKQVLTGVVDSNIKGIVAANGYLIVWDDTSLIWSSQSNELDFTPSLVTGAGGGSVNEAKGKLVCAFPTAGGFIIYCERNAVVAKYTANVRFPFAFAELSNSAGIVSSEHVSWQSNISEQYAWTTAGLQKVDKNGATNIFPELTDFLATQIFEDFNETTLQFEVSYTDSQLFVHVTAIADRFLIFSYGIEDNKHTHALFYDLTIKRWGKLKLDHVSVFQWNAPNLYGEITYDMLDTVGLLYDDLVATTYDDLNSGIIDSEEPKKTIAFLQQDGTVKIVNFDVEQSTASGILVVGKFQFVRTKRIRHQWCEIESIVKGNNFSYYILPTNDGKTFEAAVPGVLGFNNRMSKKFYKLVDGRNVSSIFQGSFNLSSLIYDFTTGGDR